MLIINQLKNYIQMKNLLFITFPLILFAVVFSACKEKEPNYPIKISFEEYSLEGTSCKWKSYQVPENARNAIAQLNEEEINQLRYIAEASQGLSSLMAQGILCFFYEICFEDEGESAKAEGNMDLCKFYIERSEMPTSASSACQKNTLIYPNPTTGELTITHHELQITNIEIYDVYGRKLSSHPLILSSSHQKINLSNLNSGIYFIKIATEQGEVVKKVVKQ